MQSKSLARTQLIHPANTEYLRLFLHISVSEEVEFCSWVYHVLLVLECECLAAVSVLLVGAAQAKDTEPLRFHSHLSINR